MMRALSLTEVREWLAATLAGPALSADECLFEGISTDTRSVAPGQLFVALRGERFDGHRFLAQARASGAVAAVVDTADASVELPQLVVSDTVEALAALASANRDQSQAELVAVTGSSGKTTVRQMAAAILARMGPTLATEGNLNNHIGVPLTMFRLSPEHRFGAVELGTSGLGEITHTVAVVKPKVAILTNAGQAHLEGFGSYQNIVRAKGEIIEGIGADGVVVLNRDDPAFDQWRQRAGDRTVRSVSCQAHPDADYRAELVASTDQGLEIKAEGPQGWRCHFRVPLPGAHNAMNAMLAVAACRALGAEDDQIVKGLAGLQPVGGRLQVFRLTDELTVIDDSYNANPASMRAALDVLAAYSGQRIAVLGGMGELGEQSALLHREVGAYARDKGIERLLTVGAGARGYAEGFGKQTEQLQSHEQAVAALVDQPTGPMTILVKGSRSSAMDLVVDGIRKKVTSTCCSG